MSPEQLKGLPPDNRSDLWAVGVILYEALTGKSPFAGPSFEAVASQVLNHQPPAPSTQRDEVGADLDFMVMKLLRKDPAHRYARAEDLIADLSNCEHCLTHPDGTSAGESTKPRLAVLYFEVLSAESDDAFLAAGLTEDLIVDLARVEGLHIASRGEVMQFRDRAMPPRTLARELGADYLLQGSVRRAGQRARISAQLVRAVDGHAVWAERFDRTLEDLFDVQAEVSRRIVDALQVTLKPGEREMLDRAPTRSQEAYAFYLQARAMTDQLTRDASFAAEAMLKRAIELDPDFALAHAALGECYARRALGWYAGLEAADQAEVSANRALQLEPGLMEAHFVLAMVHRLRGEPEALLASIDRILAMDPDHAEALAWAGWSYMSLGRPEPAAGLLERASKRRPENYSAARFLLSCYEMLGRDEDAARTRRQLYDTLLDVLRRHPENVHARSLVGTVLVQMGEPRSGVEQAERTVAMAPNDGRIRYNAACTYAAAGLADRALAELKEGTRHLPSYLSDWPRHDPDLASLHDSPEFISMFGKAGAK
jgi:TolB-like protein/Tfp pilus assembly protein PilF